MCYSPKMANVLFKFCSGAGAISILKGNSIFITSPLDLNDPFEMRPAWTDQHEQRHFQDEQLRSQKMAGMPIQVAVGEGKLKQAGTMPYFPPQKLGPVESHRGTSDLHNTQVFDKLHSKFRVLSLVGDLFDIAKGEGESDVPATLMWAHYADKFQGVCLALDTAHFDNGIHEGGFLVKYPPERQSLPPSYYDCWQSLPQIREESVHQLDAASGLHLTAAQRAEREYQHYLNLLTHKSPGWEYEHEVRMIYDFPKLSGSKNYKRIDFECESCRQKQIPVEQCAHPFYHDAIVLPPEAVRAVIFGVDCSIKAVQHILKVLSDSKYGHVQRYWSCLHSDKYVVQYMKDDHDYISFMQGHRAHDIADAKKHRCFDGESSKWWPAPKGVNYLPQKPKNSK